ncbi:hypothetical protein H5410_059342 [Solanum commersonii]|uniref:DUF7781 domain-containing protein n=1 Tax=Solanum commersonii TaxID=4109 RepID=A0A9J5W2L6_SOLCO|nr:hypothetical protein H5410_059342 [Solanum commersonii]
MEEGSLSQSGEEPKSWDELYNVNLMPSEIFLKFRKEIEGYRVGVNLEFYNAPYNEYLAKLVLKPLAPERRWKFIYEPLHHEVRLLSKKIPVTKFLNLQVELFQLLPYTVLFPFLISIKVIGQLVGNGSSRLVSAEMVSPASGIKHLLDYVLVWISVLDGKQIMALGTGEPLFNMNSGRLQASLDRVEAIFSQ